MRSPLLRVTLCWLVFTSGCDSTPTLDGGVPLDAAPPDAGLDAGPGDAGPADGGPDSGVPDAGAADAGAGDAGPAADGGEVRRQMRLVRVDTARHPNAVCSDGSPAAFHIRPGTAADANRWVIWFEGGGFCVDEERCRMRATDIDTVSSLGLPESRNPSGILSDDPSENPEFHTWTQVRLAYCSSDRWTGQRADSAFDGLFPSDPSRPFYFRGRFNVDAIVSTLRDAVSGRPSLADATDVVLTGSSGGAHGLRANLDHVAGPLLAEGARVHGLSDAGLFGYVSAAIEAEQDAINQRAATLWQAALDASCVTAHSAEPGRCLETALLLEEGHLSTPAFFTSDQIDPNSMFEVLGLQRDDSAAIAAFSRGVRERLQQHATGAFSPTAGDHVIVATDRFAGPSATRIGGNTLSAVFSRWRTEGPGSGTVVIE